VFPSVHRSDRGPLIAAVWREVHKLRAVVAGVCYTYAHSD
jgi:hypothetical protein